MPVGLRLSPGTHAAPVPTESEAPSDPAGWLLPRSTPQEHRSAVARTSERSRLSPTQLGAARRMPKPQRDRPQSRGRGGVLEAHSPPAIGRPNCTNANFYWLAVAWGGALGGSAGSRRSDWSALVTGPASLRSRGRRARGAGEAVGGRRVGVRRWQEPEESASPRKGETMTRRNNLETRAGTSCLVPPRPELVEHCSRLRR